MTSHGCTIVARNYLAHARVLARRFLEHHPGGRFSVLCIDGSVTLQEGDLFDLVQPHDIFDPREFARMATIYSVIELATAVKPTFLQYLLAEGSEAVLYLDPDIEVFAALDDISDLARRDGIVLTPHLTVPHPRSDGLVPTEDLVLTAGIYNLGFIGVGAAASEFLAWWKARLARECVVDTGRLRFVDQRWIDLVPGYFGAHVIRDPGLNVAWWNLPSRRIELTPDGVMVDGQPLRFLHFSGYDPSRPHLFSKHQGRSPRVLLSEHPELITLCDSYRRQLVALGFAEVSGIPYSYDQMPSGRQLDQRMRRAYRSALLQAETSDGAVDEPPCPFVHGEEEAFVEWLRQPVNRGIGTLPVGRYLEALWSERADLQAAFPNLRWFDSDRFLEWVQLQGTIEAGVPEWLFPSQHEGNSHVAEAPHPSGSGVNVFGYFQAELGVGEAARQILSGIDASDIPHATVLYDRTPSRQGHPFTADGLSSAIHATNIICVNADQYLLFNHEAGPTYRTDRYNIAVWWWEVANFPDEYSDRFPLVDEIWVGSEFVATAVRQRTELPVYVMPLPVSLPSVSKLTRADLGLGDEFLFLFSFDFFSVFARKNPLAVIDAFRQAFTDGEGPRLLIKSINGDQNLEDLELLRSAAAGRSDVTLWDGYVEAERKDALMAHADCYVSLHRSEGFGLTMAEAMVCGRPVIATGYSGNLTFMDNNNSYLVHHKLVGVPTDTPPYPAGTPWAEPDLDEAARYMRDVFSNRETASAVAERGKQTILANHAPQVMGEFVRERLAAIRAGRIPVKALPGSGPRGSGAKRRSFVRRAARRVLFRALRPQSHAIQLEHERLAGLIADVDSATRSVESELRSMHDATTSDTGRRQHQALAVRFEDLLDRTNTLSQEHQVLRSQLTPWPFTSDSSQVKCIGEDGAEVLGFESELPDGERADTYRFFEAVFRGSEDFIKDRQRVYLTKLGDRAPVLDFGCGRGEFLDLLRDAGIPVTGVDSDAGMIARCREKGHEVEHGDGIAMLGRLADDSLGAIFSAQVIEHLPYNELLAFFALAQRKLSSGGVLIAETVNPHSLAAFKTFWLDPTHRSQIFPEVALTLCRSVGFASGVVFFPAGTGKLEVDRLERGEYAIIATKGR